MNKNYIKILGGITVAIAIVLIVISVNEGKKYKFRMSAEELHRQVVEGNYMISPMEAQKIIERGDDRYVFIDIRNPREFDNFHLDGAVNVPLQRVLDDGYVSYLKNEKIKVLYSDEGTDANQVRLLLTQYGYENLLVLQGGVDFWKENMITRDLFKPTADYEDEKLRFDPDKLK